MLPVGKEWLAIGGQLATIMPISGQGGGGLQQEFMSWRRMNLLRFFLQNSPTARYDKFTQIFSTGVSDKNAPPVFKSDDQYVYDFLNRLEVTGPSIAAIAAHRTHIANSSQRFLRVFPQPKVMRATNGPGSEPEQLLECIRLAINMVEGGVTLYQQLEQRLQVASPDSISAARNKLVTLFKLLLKRREALPQGSIEHESATSVSGALLQALQKSQEGQEHYKLGELQAMEQLLLAREYQRKGQEDMAMNSLEEICRNQGASSKTRLEALRVLCSSGEQQGDATILQSLVIAMGGQQQYEQMLLSSIRKIKDRVGG